MLRLSAYIRSQTPFLIITFLVFLFSIYFSIFGILRMHKMYAHYFDLGIMHQTTYNSFMALKTGDFTRILEITDPHDSQAQVKRMAIHNDIMLGILAPFYFIHEGPETLIMMQAIIVSLGAFFVFHIAQRVFQKQKYRDWIACAFACSYLLYPPLQKAVNFDFHAVTLAPTFILGMYYFWLEQKYVLSFLFLLFLLTTKEQVGLVGTLFGIFIILHTLSDGHWARLLTASFWSSYRKQFNHSSKPEAGFGALISAVSLVWVIVSLSVIIPTFRGEEHFGSSYYSYLFSNPFSVFGVLFRYETFHYIGILLSPIGLLALLSPPHLFLSLSEFGVNILSSNGNMRNIYFHYDTAITGILFIASIYGGRNLLLHATRVIEDRPRLHRIARQIGLERGFIGYIFVCAMVYSLYLSPLPWGHHRDTAVWGTMPEKVQDVMIWKAFLKDDRITVSSTGHIAPHFTSRRRFLDFAGGYADAEYVVIDRDSIGRQFQAEETQKEYDALQRDARYIRIYSTNGIEVYKRFGTSAL